MAKLKWQPWGSIVGRVSRELHQRKSKKLRRKLNDLLSRADDTSFLQMAWAVDALQSSFGTNAQKYLSAPKEAATTKFDSPYFVFKWDIETLILLLLSTPKCKIQDLDCSQFGAMAQAVNLLRSLENSESGALVDHSQVLMEMHRIGQRQFGWQRGFATSERLYRFTFIYGQGDCGSYFRDTYGLTIEQFMEVSFVLYAQLHTVPWTKPPNLKELGLDPALMEKVLPLISRPLAAMRVAVKSLIDKASARKAIRIAYLPSVLRQFPVISSPEHGTLISPLPDLLMFRATAGLYYDVRTGPQHLLAEANDRFEQYTRRIIKAFCPRFEVLPSEKYGPKKASIDTPDVVVRDGGQVVAVIECKATKLTYEAQFADNPIEEAERAYAQIVKGVAQLWKFFSHVRRGIYDRQPVAASAHGVVLTMESWMQMSSELQTEVLARAKNLLQADPGVTDADMRPIIFCSIQDLVDVMFISNEDELLTSLANAELPKFTGWGFREVRRGTGAKEKGRAFPLDVEELLPWWNRYDPRARSD